MTNEQGIISAQLPGIHGTFSSFQSCTAAAAAAATAANAPNASGLANLVLFPLEPNTSFDDKQHVPFEKTIMSNYGPFERTYPSSRRLSGDWIMRVDDGNDSDADIDVPHPQHTDSSEQKRIAVDENNQQHRSPKSVKVHFYEFAVQVRLQRHHERRRRLLRSRRRILQRSIALSARLQRTGSWVEDGLVEISRHNDTTSFQRVFIYVQDLIDICYSHWNHEIQSLDSLANLNPSTTARSGREAFFVRLASQHQTTLLDLLNNLRSNPQFLTDRFRNLSRSQVATLTTKPKWEASDSFLDSFSQDSGGQFQRKRRLQAYSRELEDYATSFERSNPLAFLLFNVYGQSAAPDSSESKLRLYTWSKVCANLLECGAESYKSLYGQLLEAFATLHDWPAKKRIELFLMDVLQRGAFLLEDNISQHAKFGFNPLNTDQAREFFEAAVIDLYWILIESGTGCYPTGALALARAIFGSLTQEKDQSDFRGHFFSSWYLNHFLKAAIMYPENEDMLLKIHISKKARKFILAPLFNLFVDKVENTQNHTLPSDETIYNIFLDLVNMLDGETVPNPYDQTMSSNLYHSHAERDDDCDDENGNIVVICASEVIKVLESLSPQAIYSSHSLDPAMRPVMRMMRHAFDTEAPRAQTKYDMLKLALLSLVEPGTSANAIHPCSESWTEVCINKKGNAYFVPPEDCSHIDNTWEEMRLSLPQQAALRLSRGSPESDELDETNLISQWSASSTLSDLFRQQIDRCQAGAQTLDCVYWRKALLQLHRQYPFSNPDLAGDDTKVLSQPYHHARRRKEAFIEHCSCMENDIAVFEIVHQRIKKFVKDFSAGLELLRLKLWYASELVNSSIYLDARNIASALNMMSVQTVHMTTNVDASSRASIRPSSRGSAMPPLFGQEKHQTIGLLKAPVEHGGPRKLADPQIEAVKRWLKKNDIDNFCPGEERLHRFCMQIHLVAKRLTGETIVESPDLWSSELFSRERSFYDVQSFRISSAPASTRPASVMSDSISGTYPLTRTAVRSNDSDTRSIVSDDRSSIRRGSIHNLFYRSLNPHLLTPELASSIGSHGRASSATTTASDLFSLPSRSVTSASVYSRPPSIMYNEHHGYVNRPSTSSREKRKFLEQLQQGLVCLLLSDLGCLVWSWGCETDAWVSNVQTSSAISDRLEKRLAAEVLLQSSERPTLKGTRRKSAQNTSDSRPHVSSPDEFFTAEASRPHENVPIEYDTALRDLLVQISQHVDPCEKLQACHEFSTLALEQYQMYRQSVQVEQVTSNFDDKVPRRRSLDQTRAAETTSSSDSIIQLSLSPDDKPSDTQLHRHIKRQLAALKPRTIFRDLQYVSSFTPKEMLDKTPAGDAFVHLGMAALEYKSELCRTMVDVADQIMTTDNLDRAMTTSNIDIPRSPSIFKAAGYWKIAALEGNPVAMREVAGLYLMHPEILPVVTSALVPSNEIFKDEKMWQKKVGSDDNRQAHCLALHWMQQAARKGDKIALQKLEERKVSLSTEDVEKRE